MGPDHNERIEMQPQIEIVPIEDPTKITILPNYYENILDQELT